MLDNIFLQDHRPSSGTFKTATFCALFAGREKWRFLFVLLLVMLLSPRWGFATDFTVKLPDGATLIWVPPASPTPLPSPSATVAPTAAPTPKPSPSPTPTPVPPVSGFITPSLVEGASLQADGFYVSKAGWQSTVFNIAVDASNFTYGTTLTIEADRVEDFDPTNRNVKKWRGWRGKGQPSVASGACNTWIGIGADGWRKLNTEGITVPAAKQTTHFTFGSATPRRERLVIKGSSGVGKADGAVAMYVNGVKEWEQTNWQFDSAARPGLPTFWCVQDDYSPNKADAGPPPASAVAKARIVSVTVAPR